MIRRSIVVGILVASVACAGREQATLQAAPPAEEHPAASATARPDEGNADERDDRTPAQPRASTRGKASSSPSPWPSGPRNTNTMPLEVTLNRSCVEPGEPMAATAVTRPGSRLGFTAYYGDDTAPDFTYVPAEANPDGTFTWSWVIKPTAKPGEWFVTVVAAHGQDGATFDAPYRIARAC